MPTAPNTLKEVPNEVLAHILGFTPINKSLQYRLISKYFNVAVWSIIDNGIHSFESLFPDRNNRLVAFKILFAIANGKDTLEVRASAWRDYKYLPKWLAQKIAEVVTLNLDLAAYRSDDGTIDREKILQLSGDIESSIDHKSKISFHCFTVALALFSATVTGICYLIAAIGRVPAIVYPSEIAFGCHVFREFKGQYEECERTIKCGDSNSSVAGLNLEKLCASPCDYDSSQYQRINNSTELFAVCDIAKESALISLMVLVAAVGLLAASFAIYFISLRACCGNFYYTPSGGRAPDENKPSITANVTGKLFTVGNTVLGFFNALQRKVRQHGTSPDRLSDALLERGEASKYGTINSDPRAE